MTSALVPNPIVNTYECKDGKYLTLMMLQFERFWALFAKTVEREDWLANPDWDTPEKRKSAAPWIVEAVAEHLKTRDRAEWEGILRASDCIWAPVASPIEIQHDPQVIATPEETWRPRAAIVAELGWHLARAGHYTDPDRLTPTYLRRPEAEEKWEQLGRG